MDNKSKKCKGSGRAAGHGCGSLTAFRKYGLCKECYKKWLFFTPEGKELVERSRIRAKRHSEAEIRKQVREQKEKHKSIAKVKQEARKVFQEYIRLRDIDLSCVCCGNQSESWDAGHYYKAEIYSGVIFDEINVNKQRVYCNQYLHGNEGEYRKGLIYKYGREAVEDLDKRAIETKGYKWSREELEKIKVEYKQKIKDLRNEKR